MTLRAECLTIDSLERNGREAREMFEIIKFIAIGKGFIAPALNGITEPLFDGGEEGIEKKSFSIFLLKLFFSRFH